MNDTIRHVLKNVAKIRIKAPYYLIECNCKVVERANSKQKLNQKIEKKNTTFCTSKKDMQSPRQGHIKIP